MPDWPLEAVVTTVVAPTLTTLGSGRTHEGAIPEVIAERIELHDGDGVAGGADSAAEVDRAVAAPDEDDAVAPVERDGVDDVTAREAEDLGVEESASRGVVGAEEALVPDRGVRGRVLRADGVNDRGGVVDRHAAEGGPGAGAGEVDGLGPDGRARLVASDPRGDLAGWR